MTGEERALVRLSAAITSDDAELRRRAIHEAMQDAVGAEEVILQSYLFLGYPAALRMMAEWRSETGRSAPAAVSGDGDEWTDRGRRICATVYGGQYERLRQNIAALHPDVEQWMLTEGYGKVLGRPGLSLRMRELCIVVLLAAQTAPAQLYSHLRGARNAGASRDDVEEALELTSAVVSSSRMKAASEIWSSILAREEKMEKGEERSCS